MDKLHRLHELDRLLKARRQPGPFTTIERELDVSKSTARRLVNTLELHGAPIIRIDGRVMYEKGASFELPGLWFSPQELFALMSAQELLAAAEPGLLGNMLDPLRKKIDELLEAENLGASRIRPKLKIIRMAGRGTGAHFADVAKALIENRQLEFHYRSRTKRELTHRKVSPQCVTHYRDNWYLDAWCHDQKATRRFAIDRIVDARVSRFAITKVNERLLEENLSGSYGAFAGKPIGIAEMIFGATSAEWVADETWHAKQIGERLPDGRYRLKVPFADIRELARDLMRYGPDVEVIGPSELRAFVAEQHRAAARNYE
jgi:predicted DNA-binding transcriptional regulator YafY